MPKIWVGRTTLNKEKKENSLKYQKTWQTFQMDVICKDELLFFVSFGRGGNGKEIVKRLWVCHNCSCRRLLRNIGRFYSLWNTYSNDRYKKTFRISRATFQFILGIKWRKGNVKVTQVNWKQQPLHVWYLTTFVLISEIQCQENWTWQLTPITNQRRSRGKVRELDDLENVRRSETLPIKVYLFELLLLRNFGQNKESGIVK